MSETEFPASGARGLGAVDLRVRVRVPAKVNLALRVAARGDDGYHQLATVFQAVALFDELTAERRRDDAITVTTRGLHAHRVDDDPTNLAVRAAVALRHHFGTTDLGVHLSIDKSIPVAGGMAGGSADAAASLLACSVLWDLDTTPDDLVQLAADIGSDVPFELVGGTALGRGRGGDVMPALARGNYHWVLALSDRGLSTPSVYACFDEQVDAGKVVPLRPDDPDACTALLDALASGDAARVAPLLGNDLQEAACQLRPELREVLAAGTAAGALAGIVSGSGPTCAFLCASQPDAYLVQTVLRSLEQVDETLCVTSPAPGAQLVVS